MHCSKSRSTGLVDNILCYTAYIGLRDHGMTCQLLLAGGACNFTYLLLSSKCERVFKTYVDVGNKTLQVTDFIFSGFTISFCNVPKKCGESIKSCCKVSS